MLLKYYSFAKELKKKSEALSPRDLIKKHIFERNHKITDEELMSLSYSGPNRTTMLKTPTATGT
jgi:hypothetical protein